MTARVEWYEAEWEIDEQVPITDEDEDDETNDGEEE